MKNNKNREQHYIMWEGDRLNTKPTWSL